MIGNGKTLFDLFNMINPNCYQAFIIQCIIENKKEEAIQYCDELLVAFEYYKWDSCGKQSGYIDSLICDSNLDKWKKIAIIHIIANDVEKCKKIIEDEIENERVYTTKRVDVAKRERDSIKDICSIFGFGSLL